MDGSETHNAEGKEGTRSPLMTHRHFYNTQKQAKPSSIVFHHTRTGDKTLKKRA